MSTSPIYRIHSSDFEVKGHRCRGKLILPEGVEKPPVIIFSHGFGLTTDMRLLPFAQRFAEEGIASFLFDYRGFNESEGRIRQLVSPKAHQEDLRTALAHIRALPQIDASRIALWGYSFGGGHSLMVASEDPDIKAISLQSPFLEPWGTMKFLGISGLSKATYHGLRDVFRSLVGAKPHEVPIIAPGKKFSCLSTEGCYEGFTAMLPDDPNWENSCPARILLGFALYWPRFSASKVNCPALVIVAAGDTLVGPETTIRAAKKLPQAEIISWETGHFDGFEGEWFEKYSEKQVEFFTSHLS